MTSSRKQLTEKLLQSHRSRSQSGVPFNQQMYRGLVLWWKALLLSLRRKSLPIVFILFCFFNMKEPIRCQEILISSSPCRSVALAKRMMRLFEAGKGLNNCTCVNFVMMSKLELFEAYQKYQNKRRLLAV